MGKPVLSSILLGTTDPERLRAWYLDRFHADVDGYGNLDLGGFGLVIEQRDDVAATNPEPGRVIVNFHVDDIQAVAKHLNSLGVTWLVEPEDRGPGWFGTVIDPDGNYVQVIEFKPEYFDKV
jgi:predicted enzyme related to lactoylglutathione lyase